jgi:membrane protein YdbS with pleckstrin-like domain
MKSFKPNPKYLTKLRVTVAIIALLVLVGGILLGWLMSFDRTIGARGAWLVIGIVAVCDVVWWVPAMLLVGPYYRSLSYDIRDDEVIVRAGVWTRSVKHVPYRTVTNLTVKRGILDRWLGLGTLDIQTAGTSGTSGAEQSLVGLDDAQEVYALVTTELRRFRGSMTPTAAGAEGRAVEPITSASSAMGLSDILNAILEEVQAIRRALASRSDLV